MKPAYKIRDGCTAAFFQLIPKRFPSGLRHCLRRLAAMPVKSSKKALASIGCWTIEIVKRSDAAKGFKLLATPLGVERTIAWLNRQSSACKRLRGHDCQRRNMAHDPQASSCSHARLGESMINPRNIMSRTLRLFILQLPEKCVLL